MNIGIIFAGGVGSRLHSKDRPKQFLEVYNKPIIIYTLEHFEHNQEIDAVVVACLEGWINHLSALIENYQLKKVKKIVPGGTTSQLSIYNGLRAAKELAGNQPSVVLIHDGVRPLISSQLLSDNIRCVKEKGNAITTGIVKETLLILGEKENIQAVPSRNKSRVAKAPQSFWLEDILGAHEKAWQNQNVDYIDSCTLMNDMGYKLFFLDGPYENIKITTPEDYFTMRAIIEAREYSQIFL